MRPPSLFDNYDKMEIEIHGFWGFLFRRLCGLIPYPMRCWWTGNIRTIYAPQHSELRTAIPKTWFDLTGIIPDFLYACIVSYVEKEKGLETWEAQDMEHPARQQVDILKEVYEWAKTGRKIAEDEMWAAYPPSPLLCLDRNNWSEWLNRANPERDACYARVHQLEEAMNARNEKYLQWIVSQKCLPSLWT